MDKLSPRVDSLASLAGHHAFLRETVRPGQRIVAAASPKAWRRVLDLTQDLAPDPQVQLSTHRVVRMLELLRKSGEIACEAGGMSESLVSSLQFVLGWDWTVVALDPVLPEGFAHQALDEPGAFLSLFDLPHQSYYLAFDGRSCGWPLDGLIVSRAFRHGQGLYLRLQPVLLAAEPGNADALPELWMPRACTWDEAAELHTARTVESLKGLIPANELADQFAPLREGIACWEPVFAMVHAALVGAELSPSARAVRTGARPDSGITTLYVDADPQGRVRYGDLPLAPGVEPLPARRAQPGLALN